MLFLRCVLAANKMATAKLRVGILGATGMVGQRFVTLLANHPSYQISVLAASSRSASKLYSDVMKDRWAMKDPIPSAIGAMQIQDAANIADVSSQCDFVFCAVDMDKKAVLELEEAYAKTETPVVSNNSAARPLDDVPMIIPEVYLHTCAANAQ